MTVKTVILFAPVLLAACASSGPKPASDVPANLQATANERLLTVLEAKGVQIYECRAKKDQPTAAEWVFVAPEADLFDDKGKKVGTHGAGPFWQANDGSRIVGSVKARADAPDKGAIPWLLLSTKSVGPAGTFSAVSSIQRVNTEGGNAPPQGCSPATLGKTERVGYLADYRLFVPR